MIRSDLSIRSALQRIVRLADYAGLWQDVTTALDPQEEAMRDNSREDAT